MTIKNLDGKELTLDEALEQYRAFIYKTAYRFEASGYKEGLDFEDVVQLAYISFTEAYRLYDPNEGIKFITFLYKVMYNKTTQAIKRYNRSIYIPVYVKEIMARIAIYDLQEETPEYISETLGIDISRIRLALQVRDNLVSNFTAIEKDDDVSEGFSENLLMFDDDYTNIFVQDFLSRLTFKEIDIVNMRYAGVSGVETTRKYKCSKMTLHNWVKKIQNKFDKYQKGEAI